MRKREKMGEKGYKKLIVWQKADELAYQVYIATKVFPEEEILGIYPVRKQSSLTGFTMEIL